MTCREKTSSVFSDRLGELRGAEKAEREEKEPRRYATLSTMFRQFHAIYMQGDTSDEMLGPAVGKRVYLSEQLLRFVVTCYFDSIYRFKMYAGTEHADRHKQAAYMYKWIAKIKPIQIRPDKKSYIKGLSWVNSYFATHVALATLFNEKEHIDGRQAYDPSELLKNLNSHLYDGLVYQAQYRNISGRAVATQLCAIEEACRANLERGIYKKRSSSWNLTLIP